MADKVDFANLSRMKQRNYRPYRLAFIILFSVMGVVFIAGPRVPLADYKPRPIPLQEPLDEWIASHEATVPHLRSELAKTIMWADPNRKQRTPLSLIYLHGFSSSHREIYPVMEHLSQELHANVFLSRLSGHGQDAAAMGQVQINDWLRDAEEALAIASELGERVMVVGTSTGGSLSVWLAANHPQVKGIVLLSPNFGPYDKRSEWMLLPWGPVVAKMIVGETFGAPPKSDFWARNFTTQFPTEGLFPMMAAVSLVRNIDYKYLITPTLVLYTKKDDVVDPTRIERFYQALGSPKKQLIDLPDASGHLLAGAEISPQTTDQVVRLIAAFIKSL